MSYNIKEIFNKYKNCVFCDQILDIVIRINDKIAKCIDLSLDYCVVEYPQNNIVNSLFKSVRLNFDQSIIIDCLGKLNNKNINQEPFSIKLKPYLNCKGCDNHYSVRLKEMKYIIGEHNGSKIINGNLYFNYPDSEINYSFKNAYYLSEEFVVISVIDRSKCLHYSRICLNKKSSITTLSWGSSVKDNNYMRFNIDKEINLDEKYFLLTKESAHKILKQIKNYNLLQ